MQDMQDITDMTDMTDMIVSTIVSIMSLGLTALLSRHFLNAFFRNSIDCRGQWHNDQEQSLSRWDVLKTLHNVSLYNLYTFTSMII